MNENKIRIILVDDHPLVRQSWKILLENNPRFHVIAECENGNRDFELAQESNPDIILVDLKLLPLNGFKVTQNIMEKIQSIRIIGISMNNHPGNAGRMLELGPKDYITKTSTLEEIIHGIDEVYKGDYYICEELKGNMSAGEQ